MTPEQYDARPAIYHFRLLVRNFGHMNETFSQQFSAPELLAIHKAWMLCGWDIYPDSWAPRQVAEALQGKVPRWDDQERPVYE